MLDTLVFSESFSIQSFFILSFSILLCSFSSYGRNKKVRFLLVNVDSLKVDFYGIITLFLYCR